MLHNFANAFWHLSVGHFLGLAAVLFVVGAVGALLRRNALIVLMSVELMLNDMRGHVFALFVIAIAAAEAAVGLAIVVGVFRATRHANVDRLTTLKH